jgi:hypothetical protein
LKASVRIGLLGAFVAVLALAGISFSGARTDTASAQIPAGVTVTKACAATTIAIGATTTCTITINTGMVTTAEPITVRLRGANTGAGPNPVYGQVLLLNATTGATGADVDTVNVTNPVGGTQQIDVGCFGVDCSGIITITEGIRGAVGGPVVEEIAFGGGLFVPLTPSLMVQPATVSATVTCAPASIVAGSGAGGAASCFIDLNDDDIFPGVVSSSNITVTLINPPAGVVLAATGTTTASFNCGFAFNAPQSCDGITVVVQSNTAGVSGPISFQINYQPDVPAVDFPVVLTRPNVAQVVAATPGSATKVCTPTVPDGVPNPAFQVRLGQTIRCVVTITGVAGTGTPATTASVTLTNATHVSNGLATASYTCTPVAGTNTCTFTEEIAPTAACVPLTQSITFAGATFTPPIANAAGTLIEVLPKDTGTCTIVDVTGAVKVCAVPPDGVPPSTPTRVFVRAGTQVRCDVTVSGKAGIAGTATVTLPDNATFAVGASDSTRTFTCVNTTTPPGTACSFTETFFPRDSQADVCRPLGPQTIRILGATLTAATVAPPFAPGGAPREIFVLPKAGVPFECPGVISPLVQPIFLRFRCGTNPALLPLLGDPVITPVPGDDTALGFPGTAPQPIVTFPPIGEVSPGRSVVLAGVGILPEAVVCKVEPTDRAGLPIRVAPAKIEVSSTGGSLLTRTGQLTTNLRIECGDILQVPVIPVPGDPFLNVDKNTCTGVTFAVVGLGVGIVDINARYEPASFAVAEGIFEIEGKTAVGFVAPAVSVNLLLSPNPVAVGATGTATARLNRVTLSCGTVVCVDPTTGLPISVNAGSALNGNVIFTIQDPTIAAWVDTLPTVTPQVTTQNQVVRRCGPVPTFTANAPFTGPTVFQPNPTVPLASFFGGCTDVSAMYRGLAQGVTNIAATFVPDLPGAFGLGFTGVGPTPGTIPVPASTTVSLPPNVAALVGLFSNAVNPTGVSGLSVVGPPPPTAIVVNLVRGCNNITPTITEPAPDYARRITPAGVLVALWEHQAATNTFRGFSPMPGAPNDLPGVTRLVPIFACVTAPATLSQPPA